MVHQDHHDSTHASESESSSMGRTPSQLRRWRKCHTQPGDQRGGERHTRQGDQRGGERHTRQGDQLFACQAASGLCCSSFQRARAEAWAKA